MARTAELQHLRRAFWNAICEGQPTAAAAKRSGVSQDRGFRWFRECGGVSPVELSEPTDRYLSLAEREEIACGLEWGESMRAIGRGIGRCASTISREIRLNGQPGRPYRAVAAQTVAETRRRRPKPRKLANERLRSRVQEGLEKRWSPEEIAA